MLQRPLKKAHVNPFTWGDLVLTCFVERYDLSSAISLDGLSSMFALVANSHFDEICPKLCFFKLLIGSPLRVNVFQENNVEILL